MYHPLKKKIKRNKQLIISSFNNNINKKIKKYKTFFSFTNSKKDDFFSHNYFFRYVLLQIIKHKQVITVITNEKNPKYYNKSKFLQENELIGINTTVEMSSNDIVSGLPKLNSLLENSFNAQNTQYFLSNLNINFVPSIDLKITNYKLFIDKTKNVSEDINTHKNKRINKDPEILLWSLFSSYKIKNSLTKSLIYSVLKTKNAILNSLVKVYKEQNIKLHKKIFAGVVNTMFNRVFIADAFSNPLLINDEIYTKLYFKLIKIGKSLNFIPPIGLIFVEGISKSVTNSTRLLNSISFRDTTNSLINHSLYQPKDWLNSIKSKLILGQRIDVGTSTLTRTKMYNNINNFIINYNN